MLFMVRSKLMHKGFDSEIMFNLRKQLYVIVLFEERQMILQNKSCPTVQNNLIHLKVFKFIVSPLTYFVTNLSVQNTKLSENLHEI